MEEGVVGRGGESVEEGEKVVGRVKERVEKEVVTRGGVRVEEGEEEVVGRGGLTDGYGWDKAGG